MSFETWVIFLLFWAMFAVLRILTTLDRAVPGPLSLVPALRSMVGLILGQASTQITAFSIIHVVLPQCASMAQAARG